MMVESEAKELSEDVMLGAVLFAHEASKKVVNAIIDLAEKAAKDPWDVAKGDNLDDLKKKLKKLIGKDIAAAYKLTDRSEEHTSELQSLMRISYAVLCLTKKKKHTNTLQEHT